MQQTKQMSQKELLEFATTAYKDCIAILEAKNHDYSLGAEALRNFRVVELFGVDPKDGFVTRMSDKLMRVGNLIHHSPKVHDERIEDTLKDLANYAILLLAYLSTFEK